MKYSRLPEHIRKNGLFCCWQLEERNGKKTKVPYHAVTGQRAKSNDPDSFVSFDEAISHTGYSGIGIGIFNGICAIDLDHCMREDGTIHESARNIVRLMHSYTEYSPSRDGLHILFRVVDFQYDTKKYYIMNRSSNVEVYVAGATSKFVTVTGKEFSEHYEFGERSEELKSLLDQCMRRPEKADPQIDKAARNAINAGNNVSEDKELIRMASNCKNGAAFSTLWSGNWEGTYPSQSEADLALCGHLAFWTGKDEIRMDRLFRQSGLMREKWNRAQSGTTYGAITIREAIDQCSAVYTPMQRAHIQDNNKTDFMPLRPLKPQQSMLPTFPVECLPEVLRAYVLAVSEHSQTSPDMAAVIGLGVLAVCLQGKYQIEGVPGYYEPLSLYTVVIAAPGERKSGVMKDMTHYLYEYEQDYNKQHADEICANKQAREALQRRIAGVQKRLEGKSRPELEKELQQLETELEELPELKPARFFADDCSSEALTSLIANNRGIFSVISTEGGIFDIMAGRYSNKANIDVWLKGHCGDAIRVDRTGREAEYIPHPALSAILSIQPSVLDEIMSNTTMTGRGLIARFLYASPLSRIGSRVFRTQPISPEVDAAYKHMVYQLMAISVAEERRTVHLSEEATTLISDYFEEHERYLIGEGQGISDWASKYIGSVLRIAGLLHLAEHQTEEESVSADTISHAIQIGKYFLAHSVYAYSMMGTDLSIQKARFIWGKIEKRQIKEIKRSELFQMCRGKFFKKTEEIFPTLELLSENGYLRLEEQTRNTAGRPADVRVIVNQEAYGKAGI